MGSLFHHSYPGIISPGRFLTCRAASIFCSGWPGEYPVRKPRAGDSRIPRRKGMVLIRTGITGTFYSSFQHFSSGLFIGCRSVRESQPSVLYDPNPQPYFFRLFQGLNLPSRYLNTQLPIIEQKASACTPFVWLYLPLFRRSLSIALAYTSPFSEFFILKHG